MHHNSRTNSRVDGEHPLVAAAKQREPQMLEDIQRVITCETPSSDYAAVAEGAADFAGLINERLGVEPETIVLQGRTHLRARWGNTPPKVVILCHQDTVWPLGTLKRIPYSHEKGVIRGPGSFDMLTGAVMAIHAIAMVQANSELSEQLGGLSLLVTGDEEAGSPTSAALIKEEAAQAQAVFVLEASAGKNGALKVARKGTSIYTVVAHGRAAHAGLEPEKGVNAGTELAHLILTVAGMGNPKLGTTVVPTAFSGGTTRNTVPAFGQFDVDVRAETVQEQNRVDAEIRQLTPSSVDARIEVLGGINRPPMQRKMSAGLFSRAVSLAQELDIPAPEAIEVGGASDGNFTAAAGVPTLDGLGAVGDGAHADHEHALSAYIAPRTALLAALIWDQLAR